MCGLFIVHFSLSSIHLHSSIITTTLSVALVLFLVGLETTLLLVSRHTIRSLQEEVSLTVVLNDDCDSVLVSEHVAPLLAQAPYCKSYTYVSKMRALQEHIAFLGADPTKYLGYNPLYASYMVFLNAPYSNSDSISCIVSQLQSLSEVSEVYYPTTTVDLLDANVRKVSLFILVLCAILFVIAWALMSNTIRLHIYSKRFLIKTMQLVGATSWVIKKPFLGRALGISTTATALACLTLLGLFAYVNHKFNLVLLPLTLSNVCMVVVVTLASGVVITMLATSVAVGKYIRIGNDRLYEI